MYALPRIYKDIFIDFIVSGYKKDNEQKIARKLVLYYIRIDRELEEFSWVDYDYIDTLMKRTSKDDRESINIVYRDYFIGLYENAHEAVRRILELATAIGAGRRPHNLIRRLAKDDRYANIPEYPSDEEQSQKDKWLFSRLAKMFDLGVQPITKPEPRLMTRSEISQMLNNERLSDLFNVESQPLIESEPKLMTRSEISQMLNNERLSNG
jgi:hypothetical protein